MEQVDQHHHQIAHGDGLAVAAIGKKRGIAAIGVLPETTALTAATATVTTSSTADDDHGGFAIAAIGRGIAAIAVVSESPAPAATSSTEEDVDQFSIAAIGRGIAAIGRGIAAIGLVPEPTTTTDGEVGIAAIGRRQAHDEASAGHALEEEVSLTSASQDPPTQPSSTNIYPQPTKLAIAPIGRRDSEQGGYTEEEGEEEKEGEIFVLGLGVPLFDQE
ncbi:hypothetical protein I316_05375 [Kwoniella heveanensis BCC8398]|uniref:Uncharacterized protein n=1 Tax=Kwoniella heveanensis BCC8398 TaxID=1296120 RepID=A0A1B9GPU3_9TREE|nr:hypothetical protein I316_05375 [Kwoniella heveanensis BCC8398]